jgi:hypothetical protein
MQPQYGSSGWAGLSDMAQIPKLPMAPRAGTVRAYDPNKKAYVVSVEGIGDRQCRRMLTGLDKPIPPGTSCVIMPVMGRSWVIIGELDHVSRAPDKALPGSSELAAERDGQLAAALVQKDQSQTPNYRPIDLQGMGEEPQFVGDASLENRASAHVRRARVKVYSFGDVLVWASGICYSLYHRATNTIYRRCRNEVFEAMGVLVQVITPMPPRDTAGMTTRRLTVRTDALNTGRIDKLRSEGAFLASDTAPGEGLLIGPIGERGERTLWGTHRAEEIDNDLGTYRLQQELGNGARLTSQIGDLGAENAAHTVTGVQNPSTPNGVPHPQASTAYGDAAEGTVGHGAHIDLEGLRITYDQETGELEVLNTASEELNRIIIRPSQLLLERAGQSFTLDDSGLTIRAKSYNLVVDGSVETTAGGNVTINATDMDVNLG